MRKTEQTDQARSGQTDFGDYTRERWAREGRMAHSLSERSYPSYLLAMWRQHRAYGWYESARTLWRRFRLLRVIGRVGRGILLLLETGTVVLLLLPLLAALALAAALMLVGGVIELSRVRRRMAEQMAGKTVLFWCAELSVLVMDAPHSPMPPAPTRQMREWIDRASDTLIIVRSPYLFSSRGLGAHGFYFARRREAANVYLARSYAVFALRRTATRVAARVVWVG